MYMYKILINRLFLHSTYFFGGRQMKKRWLSVILVVIAICLVLPIVAACGGNRGTDTNTNTNTNNTNTNTGTGGGNTNTGTGGGNENIGSGEGNADVLESKGAPVVKYLRIAEIGANSVTIKFNIVGDVDGYEIKTYNKEITDKTYDKATDFDGYTVTGDGAIKTVVLNGIKASAADKVYISVKAKNDFADSPYQTVRAGGIEMITLDHTNPQQLYNGETNRGLTQLIDEQDIVGDPLHGDYDDIPTSRVGQFWYEEGHVFHNYVKDFTDERYGTQLAPIIDLEYVYYVDTVMLYYGATTYNVTVRASKDAANFNTPEDWDFEQIYTAEQIKKNNYLSVKIGIEARYVQVEFTDGHAPTEALVYGYAVGEDEKMPIKEPTHVLPTVGEMMGQCGFVAGGGGNCTIEQLSCSYVVREYHNVGWSYSLGSFPGKAAKFVNTVVGNFDRAYKDYSEAGLLVIPCLQWNEQSAPARLYDEFENKLSNEIASWEEKYLPSTYAAYADLIYQYAARYGSSKMGYLVENILTHSDATFDNCEVGRGYIEWIELGNEPNGEDAAGATPYQLAALTSAAYDGHQRTLLANVYNPNSFAYPFGGKTADPDIKLAIAGLAGIQDRYIMTMTYWMRSNRTDDSIAMDAFNVHTYFGKYFYMNDQSIIVGVSPEEFGLVDAMSDLVQFRDKYYPDVEVWLTEFGWDTNQSYETMTSAHAYNTVDLNGDGEISEFEEVMRSREIQGMWLVRAYILLASCGVDKATMYMCEDAAGDEVGAIGKYGTCGIWTTARTADENRYQIYDATQYDEEGKVVGEKFEVYAVPEVVINDKGEEQTVYTYYRVDNKKEVPLKVTGEDGKERTNITIESKMEPKDGYYYMYTLMTALGSMRFVKEVDSGNKDVWIYEFSNGEGKVGYAVWCPTSNGTVVEDYVLTINGNKATLIECDSKNKDIDGVSTNLEITNNTVKVTVGENPVYVIVE